MKKEHTVRNAALMAKYGASSQLVSKLLDVCIDVSEATIAHCDDRLHPLSAMASNGSDLEESVAFAVKQAHAMHEESWVVVGKHGEYTLDEEACFMVACEQQALPPHLWRVLFLANYGCNDLTEWTESVLAGTADEDVNDPGAPCEEEIDAARRSAFDGMAKRLVESIANDRSRDGVPPHTYAGLVAYRDQHLPVGDFLRAVLTNDLGEAVCRADDMNLPALVDIVNWVHNNMPVASYGSPKRVEAWLKDCADAHPKSPYCEACHDASACDTSRCPAEQLKEAKL